MNEFPSRNTRDTLTIKVDAFDDAHTWDFIRFPIGTEARIVGNRVCTRCAKGGDSSLHDDLVAVLELRENQNSPTAWDCRCPRHYAAS